MKNANRIKPPLKARVGLYTIGLDRYWIQFKGLHDRLVGYGKFIEKQVSRWAEVHNFGMVDNEAKAHEAGEWFNSKNVDILFCHAGTYSTSASNLPVVQICKRPVVILNLQPTERMNYLKTTTGEWLAHCNACCTPELSNAFARAGIRFHVISGLLGLDKTPKISVTNEVTHDMPDAISAWKEIEGWSRAAGATRTLQYGRMGFLGNTYPGMLDMYSDFTMVEGQTGLHMQILEMCELARIHKGVTSREKKQKLAEVKDMFILSEDSPADPLARKPRPDQLDAACGVAVALEKLVRERDLDGLTYYYSGSPGNEYERIQESFILGLSLLTARGIPCSGEGDTKTCIGMKICDTLGVGGSYCEIVSTDYVDQTIIMGHDGPFHMGISDRKPILRGMGLYHGKWGTGVSVEAKVRSGPITNLGVTQTLDGRLKMIVNQGIATDGETLRIGNTMTPVRFAKNPSQFMDEWFQLGPTHHFAMSVGHNAKTFEKVAKLLDWPYETVSL